MQWVLVRRRAASTVRKQYNIFNCLKLQCQLLPFTVWSIFNFKTFLKIMKFTTLPSMGPHRRAEYEKRPNSQKYSFLFRQRWGKSSLHGYGVNEALYLNFESNSLYVKVCEIHDPWVRGSGPLGGPIWQHSDNY